MLVLTQPQVWTLIAGFFGFLALFAGMVNVQFASFRREMTAEMKSLRSDVNSRIDRLDDRLDRLDGRVERLEDQVKALDRDVQTLTRREFGVD